MPVWFDTSNRDEAMVCLIQLIVPNIIKLIAHGVLINADAGPELKSVGKKMHGEFSHL